MNKNKFSINGLSGTILFAIAGTIASFIPLSHIIGADGNFTLFELIGPLPTAFLGIWAGSAAIIIAKISSTIATGAPITGETMIRFLPVLVAGAFFFLYNKNEKFLPKLLQAIVPFLCILIFIFHPAIFGTAAMIYPFYWLIPIAILFLPKNIFLRSLGATFSQHAVGSTIFLYTIPALANPQVWLTLIPIVALERLFFASGITLSFATVQHISAKYGAIFRLRTDSHFPSHTPHKHKKEKE